MISSYLYNLLWCGINLDMIILLVMYGYCSLGCICATVLTLCPTSFPAAATRSQTARLALSVNPRFRPLINTRFLASVSSTAPAISSSQNSDFLFWAMATPDWTLIFAGIIFFIDESPGIEAYFMTSFLTGFFFFFHLLFQKTKHPWI